MDYELREYTADNTYSTRERTRRRNTNTQPDPPRISDLLTSVIITQFTVFLLMLLLFFLFYKTESKIYIQLNSFYNSVMQKDLTSEEIEDAIKSVISYISQPKTENKTSDIELDEDEFNGAGGEDLLYVDGTTASFSPVYLSVPMVIPVEYTRVSSSFGYRINPVTQKYGFHSGIDLAAESGTPIKAAFDGTVSVASSSAVRGNYIFLESSGGITTVYCHCSELIAQQGANVRAGEIIAKVGSTGQATGPHLHFELRINGVRHNPRWVIEA